MSNRFDYTHDDVGNRRETRAGGDESGLNQRIASYSPNILNQYTSRTVPRGLDVFGIALATATVTVDGQAPYRKGEYPGHPRSQPDHNVNIYGMGFWNSILESAKSGQLSKISICDFITDLDSIVER